ncbi:ABC transporter ATP-binding protein [Aquibacillus rhizosphaerae]|uniref:ABC transporter ATP-binding protein n=1 Tax=Aquibacillus rhizosphaerae TaxID=3051431 RepID=A0ABT7L7L1_9BACI|nr:ABC transporter ATP-binding protein [Aquibacillus sp. LR5S19]MDL4841848.1 ABC transporter ATP-binding protein [Aquibacillus sp. LR5S19]
MIIEANNLTKTYKNKIALNDISFSLEEPKIYGLLGRNGAGKTTFMQVLAGLLLPTNGSVLVNGQTPFDNQKITESICLIKEGDNFKKDLKVKNVLTIASMFYPTWDNQLAFQLIDEFSLDLNVKVKTLSKGMESALGIIVGLASKAPITMFDEPYIGLDASARNRFYEVLVEQYQEHKRTIIFSTHLIDEVSLLFEEVLIFEGGKLIVKDDTDELRESCFSVSGPVAKVEAYIANKKVVNKQEFAGMLTATVLNANKQAAREQGFDVEGVPIQKLMIYLTSKQGGGVK